MYIQPCQIIVINRPPITLFPNIINGVQQHQIFYQQESSNMVSSTISRNFNRQQQSQPNINAIPFSSMFAGISPMAPNMININANTNGNNSNCVSLQNLNQNQFPRAPCSVPMNNNKDHSDNSIPPAINFLSITDVQKTLKTAARGTYQCEKCDKRFKHEPNLISHRRIHDIDCPSCKVCGKKFARKSNLSQHLRTHTDERPYKCEWESCSKAFKQKHSLIDHIRTHTGERPFQCDICLKRFAIKHNMKVHRRIHTGEKPYECDLCHRRYSSKSGLNSHLKHRHKITKKQNRV